MRRRSISISEKVATLRQCRYFAGASDEVLQQLASGMQLNLYQDGEVVFWEGESCSGLHILRRGSVKLFKISPQGREMIMQIFSEGDSFNEVPVFDESPNPINVAALGEAEIWVVDCLVIRQAVQEHPEMAQAIILNLSANLRMLVRLVEELSFYQVTNRLARLISQLPREQLLGSTDQRLTQDELAARLGTVREVVARSLKQLERSGAIEVSRRHIQITNEIRLKEWAQLPYE
jgi:CRP/FNR family transcriptional regulator